MKHWKWMSVRSFYFFSVCRRRLGAQDFPKGPINYMNPFNPGGEVDIAARAMQPSLEKNMGVPFVIQYLPRRGRSALLVEAGCRQTGWLHDRRIQHSPHHPSTHVHEGCRIQNR